MPTVLNGMYFKGQMDYFGKILQNLAFLRPELVIPPVMERLFVAFDTLTEPHKLTSSMSSVFSMARSVVDPAAGYKEPPTQVLKYTMETKDFPAFLGGSSKTSDCCNCCSYSCSPVHRVTVLCTGKTSFYVLSKY